MIAIEADADEVWDSSTDWAALADRAVRAGIAHSAFASLAESPTSAEISVRFTTDEEVRSLNASYRGKDKATNVLSFPMVEPDEIDELGPAAEILLGDIVLAHGICMAEAADKGVTAQAHASHLVVHGTLHLLGYDHETGDADAEEMEAIERRSLDALGIADPYPATEVQP